MSDAPSSDSDQRSHPTNDDSDQVTDDEETLPPSEILANLEEGRSSTQRSTQTSENF